MERMFVDTPVFAEEYRRVLKNLSNGPLADEGNAILDAWYVALANEGIEARDPDVLKKWNAGRRKEIMALLREGE